MLSQYNNIFIVGIKGVAMANIARILVQMGKNVSGSDIAEEFITDKGLEGVSILTSFDADLLPDKTDLVVYSAAHGGDANPQVWEAHVLGITVMHQAQVIAELIKTYKKSIAVAGCHGKTTTSALLAFALDTLGHQPGYLVGVSGFNTMAGGAYGKSDYFVLEADEYAMNPPSDKTPKFHCFHPTHALILNIDFDHPDVYDSIEETKAAFRTFLLNVKAPADDQEVRLVLCADDLHTRELADTLARGSYVTYGATENADVVISEITSVASGTQFRLNSTKLDIHETFTSSLYGEKNALNTAGAITMLRMLGFSLNQIQIAIERFVGAKRRFEVVEKIEDSYIIDDYAHHPQEIAATIQAARSRFPDKRIVVIFQPHTYSRTQSLQHEFVHALEKADVSLIAPIFGSAREQVSDNAITSEDLGRYAEQEGKGNVLGYNTKEGLGAALPEHIRKGDVVFTMGAGDIYKMAGEIRKMLI